MRREVAASYLKLAGVLLAGLIMGRFGLPRIEPQTMYYVSLVPEDGKHSCSFGVISDKTVLGRRIEYGEEIDDLKCSEDRAFHSTVLGCRCWDRP